MRWPARASGKPAWKRRWHRLAAKPVPPRPVPRLYLATPVVDDPSQLVATLPGLLARADVAAVLLRLRETDQRTMISRIKALAPAVQNGGAAPKRRWSTSSRRSGRRMRRRSGKPKRPSRDSAGNEAPAFHIDPRALPDDRSRRICADLADAARRASPRCGQQAGREERDAEGETKSVDGGQETCSTSKARGDADANAFAQCGLRGPQRRSDLRRLS